MRQPASERRLESNSLWRESADPLAIDHARRDHLVPMASGTLFALIVTAGQTILQI